MSGGAAAAAAAVVTGGAIGAAKMGDEYVVWCRGGVGRGGAGLTLGAPLPLHALLTIRLEDETGAATTGVVAVNGTDEGGWQVCGTGAVVVVEHPLLRLLTLLQKQTLKDRAFSIFLNIYFSWKN